MSIRSRRAVAAVVVAFLLVAGGLTALYFTSNRREVTTSSSEAYEAYKEGVEANRRYYRKEAQVAFARALSLDPNFAMAMLRLAMLSNPDQAKSLIERAEHLRSRLTDRERMYLDLMKASTTGTYAERLTIARAIHEKYPDDIDCAMILAGDEMSQGRAENALKIYTDMIAQDPNNAEIYNQVGYYYASRGNYEKGIEALKKYQFMAPDQANPFDSLGEVQAFSGHYDEAIANLNKALALKSDFYESTYHLGVAYEGKGEPERAIQYYLKAANEAPTDGRKMDILTSVMRVGFNSGNREAVREAARRVAELPKGKSTEIWTAVADIAVDLSEDRTSEAEKRLNELKPKLLARYENEVKDKTQKPFFPIWNQAMATVKQRQGKIDEAIALWEINANPPNGWENFEGRRPVFVARAHLAELLARKGDLDGAEKLLSENRKWNPSWAPTRPSELVVEQARRDKVLAASAGAAGDAKAPR